MSIDPGLRARIQEIVDSDSVVLFMKGTRHFPQCGFSNTVTQILNQLVKQYTTVNVLTDPAIRDGVKQYSEWPTIPQLYVKGKFVGGCDIVKDMYQSGELQDLLGAEGLQPAAKPAAPTGVAPKVSVSAAAKQAIAAAKGDEAGQLRLEISADFEHALSIDDPSEGDFRIDAGGITVLVDAQSAPRANNVHIDYDEGGAGFKIDNPNEGPKVRQISPADLKAMLDRKEPLQFFDVRTPEEQQQATIGARLLDEDAVRDIQQLDHGTPLVFHCHHGMRSQAQAQRFVQAGFREVYNLAGGIDAWSQQVDPSVPRY